MERRQGRRIKTAVLEAKHSGVMAQNKNGRPEWYLNRALRCLRTAFGERSPEPPFCPGCGVEKAACKILTQTERKRKGGEVTRFVCQDCNGEGVDKSHVHQTGNWTLEAFADSGTDTSHTDIDREGR
jgi:hypothetical protein